MNKMIGATPKPMTDTELATVTVPTALLWGRRDRMVPLAIAEAVVRNQGRLMHVIDDAVHAPQVEQPTCSLGRCAS